MDYNGFTLVVWCFFFPLAHCQSFSCSRIKVIGAAHHTAYNGIYINNGDQCRGGDNYKQENGDGLLLPRSGTDGWVVVANPQMETCPRTTDSNIRLLCSDEVVIPSMVVYVWSEFVDQKVMLNNKLIVECDDILMKVSCTHSSISSMQSCPWGSKINIEEAYYFTDGSPGEQTCDPDNVVCKLNFTQEELSSLRSHCDGYRACLPWVVPSIRHRNCERNSSIQCDETADTMDGFIMAYKCRRNRGCQDLRLVNTAYHSDFPSSYSQVEGVMCNERNVYSNGSYYLWYITLSGLPDGWYFGQQIGSSFQCDGAVGTVATGDRVQYPEDATVWYESPNTQDFHQTAAMVVCEDEPVVQPPVITCTPQTTLLDTSTYTMTAPISPATTQYPSSIIMGTTLLPSTEEMFKENLENDNSEVSPMQIGIYVGVLAGGLVLGGVITSVVILMRRRRNKRSQSSPPDNGNNAVTAEMRPQVTSPYENTGGDIEYEMVNATTDYSTIRENVVTDYQNFNVPNADYLTTTTNNDNAYQMLKESRGDYVNVTENTGPNVYTSLKTNTQ